MMSQLISARLSRAVLPAAISLLAICSLLSSAAWSAQQGITGNSSSGNITINYVQGLNTRISGFNDMPLGTWSGSGPLTANDNICIGRSGIGFFGTGTYRILAQGDGASGDPAAFTLSNGASQIYYNAYFNDQTGTTNRQQLTPGLQLTGQSGFGFWMIWNLIFGCSVNNANVSIEVPESELASGVGTYTGTLTLTLIPE